MTVNQSINPATALGFNFNNPNQGLGNNPVVNPGIVGFQGLGNLGVGRVSPTAGIGGFVFSAASDSFNLLIRALKQQQRLDVLSRPQIMTLDNQAAQVAIGQSFPYTLGSNVTATGVVSNNINYRDIGVILNVIPHVNPDGKVTMRVTPQVSSVVPANQFVNLGNGNLAPVFNQQILDTTIIARDGETVAVGGLITRSDAKSENKIPWFGDLPVLGTLFRYRTQNKKKVELLVILTPHIVRNRFEADRILAEESRRMDWVLSDVIKTQGMTGNFPMFPPAPDGSLPPGVLEGPRPSPPIPATMMGFGGGVGLPPGPVPGLPAAPAIPGTIDGVLQLPRPVPPTVPPTVPPGVPPGVPELPPAAAAPADVPGTPDRPLANVSTLKPPALPAPAAPAADPVVPPVISTTSAAVPAGAPAAPAQLAPLAAPAAGANDGKESDRWRLFRRGR
jgi:hypothetical protein